MVLVRWRFRRVMVMSTAVSVVHRFFADLFWGGPRKPVSKFIVPSDPSWNFARFVDLHFLKFIILFIASNPLALLMLYASYCDL
jgi:hypothetical protein